MSIEEKAKAYDKALENAKAYFNHSFDVHETLQIIFPELAESEDEKIRKNLMAFLISHKGENRPTVGPTDNQIAHWVAWLEKQGEKKYVEWSEKDEIMIEDIINELYEKKFMVY